MDQQGSPTPLGQSIARIRELIAHADLGAAIDQLQNLAYGGSSTQRNEALQLRSRSAELARDEREGIADESELRRERRALTKAISGLTSELERTLPGSVGPVRAPRPSDDTLARVPVGTPEKIIGLNNLRQVAWLEQGIRVSRAVCRILTPDGMGTGFLVAPHLLMTNNHVIPSPGAANAAVAEFNYQLPFGVHTQSSGTVRYSLAPHTFFKSDDVARLDYTVVAIDTKGDFQGTAAWGCVALNPNADPLPHEHVIIIQHPNGQPKQIALTANAVLQVCAPYLHYSTDTMPGSSGSPVFNDLWQVIALHHAAGPAVHTPDKGYQYSNEGVLVSSIKRAMGTDWPQ